MTEKAQFLAANAMTSYLVVIDSHIVYNAPMKFTLRHDLVIQVVRMLRFC